MFYKTKNMSVEATQYNGDNLKELREIFPELEFKLCCSMTTFNGIPYNDVIISDGEVWDDLLVGDWVAEMGKDWEVIPMHEFKKYWEKI